MKLEEVAELYNMISRGSVDITSRKESMKLRKVAFDTTVSGVGFTKVAFDTRRIDQESDYNPRRGLQNYSRSEAFISEANAQKLKNFAKLRKVLNDLKEVYGREPEWQDSNARVLLNILNAGLRTDIQDGDYTESQPSLGSLNYLEELMHVRYRLGFDDMTRMTETDLRKALLARDEELVHKDVNKALEITKQDVSKNGYDTLLEKLFDGCRASADNPDVERTITITIRDKFHKES
jgi:hypothetical protein